MFSHWLVIAIIDISDYLSWPIDFIDHLSDYRMVYKSETTSFDYLGGL